MGTGTVAMNTLSWIIYLAELSETLKAFLAIATAAAVFATAGFLITYAHSHRQEEVIWLSRTKISAMALIVSALSCAMLPSRQTVMLIVASELGERVVSNAQITSVVDPSLELLNAWISKTTQDLKGKKQ
jgi:hypothetical protein